MLKKATFLTLGVALCGLVVGCGSGTTPAEIAQSYGILNRCDLQPGIAGIIQSGQADKMIENGQAAVRNRVVGSGKDRILVTEYLIQGEVYRVEVRRAINPTENVKEKNLSFANSKQGTEYSSITWGHLLRVWRTLKNESYEAQAAVAYRAWRGLDGKVHGVKVVKGEVPDWQVTENVLDLTIGTKKWPMVTMWFQGLTSDGRQSSGGVQPPNDDHVNTDIFAQDGRWLMTAPGPGVQCVPFVNTKLYDVVKG
ncbi:MAG: hypothetical protein K8S55_11515 [Phycisphaerae bacterium]|nr:hypothetical protein [Phycisphaerae bacterium]